MASTETIITPAQYPRYAVPADWNPRLERLSAAQLDALRGITSEQVAWLLGEIVEPSVNCPWELSDELADVLFPVSKFYAENYKQIAVAAGCEE